MTGPSGHLPDRLRGTATVGNKNSMVSPGSPGFVDPAYPSPCQRQRSHAASSTSTTRQPYFQAFLARVLAGGYKPSLRDKASRIGLKHIASRHMPTKRTSVNNPLPPVRLNATYAPQQTASTTSGSRIQKTHCLRSVQATFMCNYLLGHGLPTGPHFRRAHHPGSSLICPRH